MVKLSVLMVCTGNICRSPTAEGVLRHAVEQAGLQSRIHVESAGTHDYHVGDPPDPRSCRHAAIRGYDLTALRARQVAPGDFERFDLVLAMDSGHLGLLQAQCPPEHRHKLRMLMAYAPHLGDEVADPYYGGQDGFETVLDQVEAACEALVAELRQRLA